MCAPSDCMHGQCFDPAGLDRPGQSQRTWHAWISRFKKGSYLCPVHGSSMCITDVHLAGSRSFGSASCMFRHLLNGQYQASCAASVRLQRAYACPGTVSHNTVGPDPQALASLAVPKRSHSLRRNPVLPSRESRPCSRSCAGRRAPSSRRSTRSLPPRLRRNRQRGGGLRLQRPDPLRRAPAPAAGRPSSPPRPLPRRRRSRLLWWCAPLLPHPPPCTK